jgi:hypothetical protein
MSVDLAGEMGRAAEIEKALLRPMREDRDAVGDRPLARKRVDGGFSETDQGFDPPGDAFQGDKVAGR